MLTLTAKSTRNYKKTGSTVFVYTFLNLSDVNKEKLKAAQKDFYREDEAGNPLWFTTRFVGETAKVVVNEKTGKLYADTSALDQAASLAAQYGGNLGQELAKISAAQLLGVAPQSMGVENPQMSSTDPSDLDKM